MAAVDDKVESALDKTTLTPTQKRAVGQTLVTTLKELKTPAGRRLAAMRAELAQYRPVSLTVLSTLGGLAAEPIRRSVVGRLVTPILQQGLGLVLLGGGVQLIAGNTKYPIPIGGPIGAAHCAYGGALIAIGMYGTDENPDAVKIAIEGTTYKALHPKKPEKTP